MLKKLAFRSFALIANNIATNIEYIILFNVSAQSLVIIRNKKKRILFIFLYILKLQNHVTFQVCNTFKCT